MYQKNIRSEVLSGDYEGYCPQGTREDADSTSKLNKYMASHKGAIFSSTESLCIANKLGVLSVVNEGMYNRKYSKHVNVYVHFL
jgi:hypothetical protein